MRMQVRARVVLTSLTSTYRPILTSTYRPILTARGRGASLSDWATQKERSLPLASTKSHSNEPFLLGI
eukprot:6772982-Pyramimonas_sp.AAC.1